MPERRFPPPWSVEETDACFIIRDANGQALGGAPPHARRGEALRGRGCNRPTPKHSFNSRLKTFREFGGVFPVDGIILPYIEM
jgi:hypothetical protein